MVCRMLVYIGFMATSISSNPGITAGMRRARRLHRSLTVLMLVVLVVVTLLSYMFTIGVMHDVWLWIGLALAATACVPSLMSSRIALSNVGSVLYCFLLLMAVECVSFAMPYSYTWILCVIPMVWAACRLSLPMTAAIGLGAVLVVFTSAITGASPSVTLLRMPMFVGGVILMIGMCVFVWQGRRRLLSDNAPSAVQTERTAETTQAAETESGDQMADVRRELLMKAHDLRSPLSSVIGYVELALRRGTIDDQSRADLTVALENAERLDAAIVSMVKSPDRPSAAGRDSSGVRRVNLSDILGEMVREHSQQAAIGRIRIVASVEPDLMVVADPLQLQSLFGNLLANAVKYNQPGGSVYVSAMRDGDTINIEVTDTGIGIPQTDLGRVRNPYVRAANVPDGTSGTGLGLHHCQTIVGRLGGTLGITSEEGNGTVATVTLPVCSRDIE